MYRQKSGKQTKCRQQIYTKKAIEPAVRVQYKGAYLQEGKDYRITYKNNKKIGKATMIIKGKGGYCGSVKKDFQIVKRKK